MIAPFIMSIHKNTLNYSRLLKMHKNTTTSMTEHLGVGRTGLNNAETQGETGVGDNC